MCEAVYANVLIAVLQFALQMIAHRTICSVSWSITMTISGFVLMSHQSVTILQERFRQGYDVFSYHTLMRTGGETITSKVIKVRSEPFFYSLEAIAVLSLSKFLVGHHPEACRGHPPFHTCWYFGTYPFHPHLCIVSVFQPVLITTSCRL